LSKNRMITFWPIQLAELGEVYALYQKWLIRWPSLSKTMDFRQLFCGFEPTLGNLHYAMDHARWQSGNAKMFSYISMATCERNRIDLSEQPFAAICVTPIGWLLVESSEGWRILPQLDSSVRYLGSLVFVPYPPEGGLLSIENNSHN
jgi:hypothetical protein